MATLVTKKIEMTAISPVIGVCEPHPDRSDLQSRLAGVRKRLIPRMPPLKRPDLHDRLRLFTLELLRKRNVPRVEAFTSLSTKKWLDRSDYPAWRKKELLLVRENTIDFFARKRPQSPKDVVWIEEDGETTPMWLTRLLHMDVKSFIKREFYQTYKFPRWINARSDVAKLAFGPLSAVAEEIICDTKFFPEFVKHIPVSERGRYVDDRLRNPGNVYVATDYTSFESHFSAELLLAVEFTMLEYLFEGHPKGAKIVRFFQEACCSTNYLKSGDQRMYIDATRMSGEMTTSLGNGFTNLVLMLFVCHEMGLVGPTEPVGVVEGDDALFSFLPSKVPTSQMFENLGCKIKLNVHESLNEASFCGLIYDENDKSVVPDPKHVIATIGWAESKYHRATDKKRKAVVRAKALSALYQYPACPIVSDLCRHILSATRGMDVRGVVEHMDWWQRKKVLDALRRPRFYERIEPIGSGTRELVERLFGITLEQQLQVEAQIKNLPPVLGPLKIDLDWPEEWEQFWQDNYVTSAKLEIHWPRMGVPTFLQEYAFCTRTYMGARDEVG